MAMSYPAPSTLYGGNAKFTMDGREAEGRAFAKAARLLDQLSETPADSCLRREAVRFNAVLWTMVQAEAADKRSTLPRALRDKLLALSLYVDRALVTLRTSREDTPLTTLIAINRDMAGGLLT